MGSRLSLANIGSVRDTVWVENQTGYFDKWTRIRTISDKHGEKYNVIVFEGEHDDLTFKVLTADDGIQETEVGYANCLYEGDGTLMLADIRLRDDVILVHRRKGLFARLRKIRRETRNFQRCGLGTELLKCVFDLAVKKGIKRIVGKIKEVDYPKNPNLPRWYASMGFAVTMEIEPSAVKGRISKDL